jgi:hypothetical protein
MRFSQKIIMPIAQLNTKIFFDQPGRIIWSGVGTKKPGQKLEQKLPHTQFEGQVLGRGKYLG